MKIAPLALSVLVGAGPSPAAAPTSIIIATARGETPVSVRYDRGHPALASRALERVLPIDETLDGGWATVRFAGQPFRFLLDAPVMVQDNAVVPLAGGAYLLRDTLFVPLQWLAEYVPRMFAEGYRYDPLAARFEEARLQPVVERTTPTTPTLAFHQPSALAAKNGFRMQHKVVIDPGHGGVDPGTPGRYLPRGTQEKDVVLSIGRMVAQELSRRGVEVVLTRSTDVLIPLFDRAPMCRGDCDLFVSIHVNSMPSRPGADRAAGVATYYIGDEVTADATRVAKMENEALRYEAKQGADIDDALGFILKDLQTNANLLESAQLADAIQRDVARRHPGGDHGVTQSPNLAVLRTAMRPAVLVETGFSTNRRDAQYLASATGQAEIAKGIADGIMGYLRHYEQKLLAGGGDR